MLLRRHLTTVFLVLLPQALGCAEHSNYRRATNSRRDAADPPISTERNWTYTDSFDWGRIDPSYELCQSGTQQSPIALTLQNGLSTNHVPTFNYPDKVDGNFYNWAFGERLLLPRTLSFKFDGLLLTPCLGPAFTVTRKDNVRTANPSLTFDNETVYLSGWHIHTPADHSVNMFRNRAELHLVHTDAQGRERAVVAILMDSGNENNTFVEQLPTPLVRFDDTTTQIPTTLALNDALASAANFKEYWTYQGSLTSPPCREGIRWFVARQVMYTTVQQMQTILAASSYSARAEQRAWLHRINE